METLYPSPFISNSDWFVQEIKSTIWTKEENKTFESALAIYGEDMPDRWFRVAAMIPGKTVFDVLKQYKELEEDVCDIEAGRVPVPGYPSSSFTLEFLGDRDFSACRKRPKGADQERKKGVPWTEDEHRRFLLGLIKYGKGDWRNISRNFVVSKTPTQVASHAQKYYQRQQSGGKDKRRPSIHDITTVNLTKTCFSDNQEPPHSLLDRYDELALQQKLASMPNAALDWNHPTDDGWMMPFDSTHGRLFVSSPYQTASTGIILEGQNLYRNACHDAVSVKHHTSVF